MFTTLPIGYAYGEEGTEIAVINPSTGNLNFTYSTSTATIGTRFNATTWIFSISDMFAFQVKLYVNDTLLNITGAWLPTWDPDYVFSGQSTVQPTPAFYDEDSDGITESVLVGDSLLTGTPFTGDGLLAIIELEIIYVPPSGTVSSSLNIDNPDTYAVDPKLNRIVPIKTSGYYNFLGLGSSAISIKASPQYAVVNFTVNISGKIEPTVEGANVTVECKPEGGSWSVLATNLTTNATGHYTYEWNATKPGSFELRASWPGNGTLEAAVSHPIRVYVKYESSITLNLSAENITAFSELTISGIISPRRQNVNVTIQVLNPITDTWETIAIVKTKDDSTYRYYWKARKITNYNNETVGLRSCWAGDNVTYGDQSQTKNVTIWKTATSITLDIMPRNVEKGGNVSIQGKIIAPEPGNLTIKLYIKNYLSVYPEWEKKETINCTAEGFYTILYTFDDIGIYGIKTTFGGNKDLLNASSIALNVTVGTISNITINVHPKEARIYSIITINGTITPKIPDGQTVIIYYKRKGTQKPRELGSTYTLNSSYTFEWNFTLPGELELQARWDGYKDQDILPASSNWISLTIYKLESIITITLSPSTLKMGENVTISGTLQPQINTTLTMYYRNATHQSWVFLSNITVINGVFSYNWTAKNAGTFEFKANWTGNLKYAPSESNIASVTVKPKELLPTWIILPLIGGVATAAIIIMIYIIKKRKG
jgi:hypothetical protein